MIPTFTLTFDQPVEKATQLGAERRVTDYLQSQQEARTLACWRCAPDDVKAKVEALLEEAQAAVEAES